MKSPHTHHRSGWAIWRWPLGIGMLTGVGLVAALFSDGGWGDHLAAACLAVPVTAAAWAGRR